MSKVPEVSIIIPTHNSQLTILETLDSVQNQTYEDFEVILVDDASTDNTVLAVKNHDLFRKNKLKLRVLSNNVGVAEARNVGLNLSKGKYVAFIDGDDVWYRNKLELQVTRLHEDDVNFVFSNYDLMNSQGEIIGKRENRPGQYALSDFLRGNPAGTLTVVVARNLLIQVGGFPNVHHEDYALWLTLVKRNIQGYLMKERLAAYRLGNDSVSSNKIKAALWTFQVLRDFGGVQGIKLIESYFRYMVNVLRR